MYKSWTAAPATVLLLILPLVVACDPARAERQECAEHPNECEVQRLMATGDPDERNAAVSRIRVGDVDVNYAFETQSRMTLLHFAVQTGDVDLVQALLDRGARANAEDSLGRLPYDMADDPEIQKLLRSPRRG